MVIRYYNTIIFVRAGLAKKIDRNNFNGALIMNGSYIPYGATGAAHSHAGREAWATFRVSSSRHISRANRWQRAALQSKNSIPGFSA